MLEQSFEGLRRSLRVWEDPHTATFGGHVRPGDGTTAITHHAAWPAVARHGAALQALLQHRHHLRLARDYARRLRASSEFLRRLLAPAGPPAPLRGLCRALRTHAGHWTALRRRLHGDPWLRPLLLCRHEPLCRMRRALLVLALVATQVTGRHVEARLRALAGTRAPDVPPALLADLCQGLGIYNRVVGDLVLELGSTGGHGASAAGLCTFPVPRVLELLATERGRRAAERLWPLLLPRDGSLGDGDVCWEAVAVPWPPERGGTGLSGREEPSGVVVELRALCLEDEELMAPVLGGLVASTDGRWHHVPRCLDTSPHAQYRPLFWAATGTALGQRLAHAGTGTATVVATVRELGRALTQEFVAALGLALTDRCPVPPVPVAQLIPVAQRVPVPVAHSRTAQRLQRQFPGLCLALRCLRAPGRVPGGPGLRVLRCCLASARVAQAWLCGRAQRYLAATALPQVLLITHGDLPLLRTEVEQLVLVASGTFPGAAEPPPPLPPTPLAHCEHRLCHQLRATATGIQVLAGDVLGVFSVTCKRLSAEIFEHTMPRGRTWRLGPQPVLPSGPSAYAVAAVQAVLGQVLPLARALPRDAQAPALAQVTTAFLEAWLEHILARHITFSLQGALQLRQDLELVRELLGSERAGLAPEARRALLALGVFRSVDGAVLCLLQQPGATGTGHRPWHPLWHCCSDADAPLQEPGRGGLDGLETLEPPGTPPPGRPCRGVPSPYVPGHQQQWLALRLHRARRWHLPWHLPCLGTDT
ncbi:coiled-coil domain-containing protein 142 [Aegotheles albertisi]